MQMRFRQIVCTRFPESYSTKILNFKNGCVAYTIAWLLEKLGQLSRGIDIQLFYMNIPERIGCSKFHDMPQHLNLELKVEKVVTQSRGLVDLILVFSLKYNDKSHQFLNHFRKHLLHIYASFSTHQSSRRAFYVFSLFDNLHIVIDKVFFSRAMSLSSILFRQCFILIVSGRLPKYSSDLFYVSVLTWCLIFFGGLHYCNLYVSYIKLGFLI